MFDTALIAISFLVVWLKRSGRGWPIFSRVKGELGRGERRLKFQLLIDRDLRRWNYTPLRNSGYFTFTSQKPCFKEILETFDLERPCHDRLPCSIWLSREARERSKHPVFVIVLPKGAHADMRGGYKHACYPCLYLTIKGSQTRLSKGTCFNQPLFLHS